jgi:hypothetical protein
MTAATGTNKAHASAIVAIFIIVVHFLVFAFHCETRWVIDVGTCVLGVYTGAREFGFVR